MRGGSRRSLVRAAAIAVCACCLAGSLLVSQSGAASEDPAARATLDRSVRFLQEAQNLDGGFGGVRGQQSDPLFTAWAAYALAAAGINPQDQAQPGGVDVFSYLTAHTTGLRETTDFDRVALVALASGTSPRAFGAVDPIGTILSRQLPDGSFPQPPGLRSGWINSTIWSIFPLSAIETPEAEAAVARAVAWLVGQQRPDGAWGGIGPASDADADMTGAAIQALNAADGHGTDAERRALEYLRGMQGTDGGFRETASGPTNSATTAWVVQGLWAAEEDPRAWQTETGADPLSYLSSLQRPDGSIGWTATSDLNSLWMTAQVGPALAGRTYPLPPVPRAARAPRREAPARTPASSNSPPAAKRGHGGTGVVEGDGVIAGGGGRGAPLFSAPQPQSAGSTPGGSRQLSEASIATAPVPAPAPSVGSRGGSEGASAPAGRRSTGLGAAVEGLLVGADGGRLSAAPGLFGADSGGRADASLALALLVALAGAAAIGTRREDAGVRVG
jgi:Squalene-hopene cyclase C-terminal domain/Prenyltransferase and squalene oxidase repeat